MQTYRSDIWIWMQLTPLFFELLPRKSTSFLFGLYWVFKQFRSNKREVHTTIIVSKLYVNVSSSLSFHMPQASQLGVYKAFVDNYKVALDTVKCSQTNVQLQKIFEVSSSSKDDQRLKDFEGCKGDMSEQQLCSMIRFWAFVSFCNMKIYCHFVI